MRVLEDKARSKLFLDDNYSLHRQFKDTGNIRTLVPTVDHNGVLRGPHNKKLFDFEEDADFRGTASGNAPPRYLKSALEHLHRKPASIQQFADLCGVKTSTAWCYAYQVVEEWPLASDLVIPFLYPPLLEALPLLSSPHGTLREVMSRLESEPTPILGDQDWKFVADRLSHLRIARLCLNM